MPVRSAPRLPALEGEPWHITGYPDLGDLAYDPPEHEVVDHAIWRARDGSWHIWACIRYTKVGRVFYGWEGQSLQQENWQPRGVVMRANQSYGENVNDWGGEEWIQAPHVIQHDNRFWMFYGGHNTEIGESQICLAISQDGRVFHRFKNADGQSRLFIGPGDARDPMVLPVDDGWLCYYCGNRPGQRKPNIVYARISTDLIHWSEPREVSWGGFISGTGPLSAQCPFVVYRDGWYYLFRTSEYYSPARTNVYCSRDPLDFGLNTDSKWVQTLRCAASEIVQDGDQWYISSVEDLRGGVQLCKLVWR